MQSFVCAFLTLATKDLSPRGLDESAAFGRRLEYVFGSLLSTVRPMKDQKSKLGKSKL